MKKPSQKLAALALALSTGVVAPTAVSAQDAKAGSPCAPKSRKSSPCGPSNPCGPKKRTANPCGPSNPCGPKRKKSE